MNRNFSIDPFSFILGFLLSSVLWWMINTARPLLKQIKKNLSEGQTQAKERGAVGMEDRYRKQVLRRAQGMHLAAPLFALDEIALPPRLLAPQPRVEPGAPQLGDDIVTQTLPYMPSWPEMAAIYKAQSLSLSRALSGGSNIIVIGHPGVGKTFTLAHFATQIINKAPEAEQFHNNLPFILHVADLDLPADPKNMLNAVIEVVAAKTSVFELNRVPKFVAEAFESGRAILLLDGADELPPDDIKKVAEFLKPFMKAYPKVRVVATGNAEYVDGFMNLGFAPLAVLPWGADEQKKFMARWTELWTRIVANETWAQGAFEEVDPILLNRWLRSENLNLTPLEYTLKIWGVFAGDIRGPRPMDAIATHIRRLSAAGVPADAIDVLAMQANSETAAIFDARRAQEWVKTFEPSVTEPLALTPETATEAPATETPLEGQASPEAPVEGEKPKKTDPKKKKSDKPAAPPPSLVSKLSQSGLLVTHRNNRLRFAHPVFAGYLAGKSMRPSAAEALLNQPNWSGRGLAMNYFAANSDATNLVKGLVTSEDEMMQRGTLAAGRLLRDAPREAPWRGQVMMAMINILQSDRPVTMRGQAVAAIVNSGDPSGAALFRQLTLLPAADLRQLAILGSGALRDSKAVDVLVQLIHDPTPVVSRAACLALVSIGTHSGLEAVASVLLSGDENQRRAAAEALSNNSHEGYATLQEASTAQDILLRRAVVYGLARLEEQDWAVQMLDKIQLEDTQWVVRAAATEVIENRAHGTLRIPKKLIPPHEAPWLIEFAGKQGMGIAPGAPAGDMLLRALKSQNDQERFAALHYLRYMPTDGVISGLYQHYFGDDRELREAIFLVLWEMSLGGVRIPSPKQFGLG